MSWHVDSHPHTPPPQFWAVVVAHTRGTAPLALAATSAQARDAVECSDGGYSLRRGCVLVAVRPQPVSLTFDTSDNRYDISEGTFGLPPPPQRPMVCVNVGGAVLGGWAAAGADDEVMPDEAFRVPRALEACRWWLQRRVRLWAVPLAVRCSDLLAPAVARTFLSHFPAGAVASLRVVVVPRAAELTAAPQDAAGPGEDADTEASWWKNVWTPASGAVSVCLGPVLEGGEAGEPWYVGLEELVVLAEHHAVAGVSLAGRDGVAVPLEAPALLRLRVQGAADVDWIGALVSLEELVVERGMKVASWEALGELDSLRRLCLCEAKVPKLKWLAGCALLNDIYLHHVRGVQDWQSLGLCGALRRVQLLHCRCSNATWMKKCKALECVWMVSSWLSTSVPPPVGDAKLLLEYCGDALHQLTVTHLGCLERLKLPRLTSPMRENELRELSETLKQVHLPRVEVLASDTPTDRAYGEAWFTRLGCLEELSVKCSPSGLQWTDAGHHMLEVLGCPSLAHAAGLAAARLPASLRVLDLSRVDFSRAADDSDRGGALTDVVRFLSHARSLEQLSLQHCRGVEALSGLCDAMQRLRAISFTDCEMPTEQTWLGECTTQTLQEVTIRFELRMGTAVELSHFGRLPALRVFNFQSEYYYSTFMAEHPGVPAEECRPKADLNFLRQVAGSLEVLVLDLDDVGVADESVLGCLAQLRTLRIPGMFLESFDWVGECRMLEELVVRGVDEEVDWTPLGQLTQLRVFRAAFCACSTPEWMRNCPLLTRVDGVALGLSGWQNFDVLTCLPHLQEMGHDSCREGGKQRAWCLPLMETVPR